MPMRVRLSLALIVVLLAGPQLNPAAQGNRSAVPHKADDRTIIHLLNRLGFGPTRAAIDRIRSMGLEAYIEEQLHPERIADEALAGRLAGFSTLQLSSRELASGYFLPAQMQRREEQRRAGGAGRADSPSMEPDMRSPRSTDAMRTQRAPVAELLQQKLLRAAYSERQLNEVLVDFWFNHFNVFIGKGQVRTYVNEYERDAIRPHVLGRFRDLLGATAQSPAMLFYLDNWQSSAPADAVAAAPPPRGRVAGRRGQMPPRQDRARPPEPTPGVSARAVNAQAPRRRGINENYARELMELHTLGVDGGYTQKDVQEVARAFTGWTIANPRLGGPFRFDPRLHDDGEKVVLGTRIKAGGGVRDGERVLDILAKHPSTARFIATKLARRLVADDPPQALVSRAAQRFRETDGDLREVVRTIVTSPEFFANDAYRAKTKNPFEFVVSAVRVTGLDLRNRMPLAQATRELGMPLYGAQPPTGYSDRAEAWVNTGALLNRMNFALALTSGRVRSGGTGPEPARAGIDRAARRSGIATASLTPQEAAEALIAAALGGDISESTAATVAKAGTTSQAAALILGSPEFQKR